MKNIIGTCRRAITDYNMINPGSKICVGVSGGKDSVALLYALKKLSQYHHQPFDISAVIIDMGFPGVSFAPISHLCEAEDIPLTIKRTRIAEIIFDIRNEKNPCALCSNLRHGALNSAACHLGCDTVALGHHHDDFLETFMLSLIYEGRINSFSPVTYLSRKKLHLIRPMIYCSERDITSFGRHSSLPVVHNPCPANGNTKRQYAKHLIQTLEHENRGFKQRLFTAINNFITKE